MSVDAFKQPQLRGRQGDKGLDGGEQARFHETDTGHGEEDHDPEADGEIWHAFEGDVGVDGGVGDGIVDGGRRRTAQ